MTFHLGTDNQAAAWLQTEKHEDQLTELLLKDAAAALRGLIGSNRSVRTAASEEWHLLTQGCSFIFSCHWNSWKTTSWWTTSKRWTVDVWCGRAGGAQHSWYNFDQQAAMRTWFSFYCNIKLKQKHGSPLFRQNINVNISVWCGSSVPDGIHPHCRRVSLSLINCCCARQHQCLFWQGGEPLLDHESGTSSRSGTSGKVLWWQSKTCSSKRAEEKCAQSKIMVFIYKCSLSRK